MIWYAGEKAQHLGQRTRFLPSAHAACSVKTWRKKSSINSLTSRLFHAIPRHFLGDVCSVFPLCAMLSESRAFFLLPLLLSRNKLIGKACYAAYPKTSLNEGKTRLAQKFRLRLLQLMGQCPGYVTREGYLCFLQKNRTVKLTRQVFLPDRTADGYLLFTFLFKIWLAARRLIAILSLAGPPRDPKISFRSL